MSLLQRISPLFHIKLHHHQNQKKHFHHILDLVLKRIRYAPVWVFFPSLPKKISRNSWRKTGILMKNNSNFFFGYYFFLRRQWILSTDVIFWQNMEFVRGLRDRCMRTSLLTWNPNFLRPQQNFFLRRQIFCPSHPSFSPAVFGGSFMEVVVQELVRNFECYSSPTLICSLCLTFWHLLFSLPIFMHSATTMF